MTPLLNNEPLPEHCGYPAGVPVAHSEAGSWENIYFRGDTDAPCVEFCSKKDGSSSVHTSYYIGADWIDRGNLALYVEPKLNNASVQTDYLKMLFTALSNAESAGELDLLFQMKAEETFITLKAQQDLLTPLLVLQFLQVVKRIVQKGLKRSYYTVTQQLRSRIKGKVLVSQTIKSATLKNKMLDTVCSYSEFGYDGVENRILQKTLTFVRRYLGANKFLHLKEEPFSELLRFIQPQFQMVSEEASLSELRDVKLNPFYKEYREALTIARLLLQRFSFNINATSQETTVSVPPFWIDMSKLFELYVLGELRKKYGSDQIVYQHNARGEYPDMLLKGENIVVDAKYKPIYSEKAKREDVRQLSGYARNEEVLSVFGYKKQEPEHWPVLPCWIIYPARLSEEPEVEKSLDKESRVEIKNYIKFFKSPINLPQQT